MQAEIFHFIRKFCASFALGAGIEFTCYELYPVFFQRYFNEMSEAYEQTAISFDCNPKEANIVIDHMMKTIKNHFILNTFILIAICTKYFDGLLGQFIFKAIPNFLDDNSTKFSKLDFIMAEFDVFRHLNFHVSIQH